MPAGRPGAGASATLASPSPRACAGLACVPSPVASSCMGTGGDCIKSPAASAAVQAPVTARGGSAATGSLGCSGRAYPLRHGIYAGSPPKRPCGPTLGLAPLAPMWRHILGLPTSNTHGIRAQHEPGASQQGTASHPADRTRSGAGSWRCAKRQRNRREKRPAAVTASICVRKTKQSPRRLQLLGSRTGSA